MAGLLSKLREYYNLEKYITIILEKETQIEKVVLMF